mmetsp:Transcript_24401/g.29577  ORF Transcript_24401/g.29577 Transcript_24401/m.29577 type:complete len:213 (-) Transcript_24401:163-801(-)
MNIHIEHQCNAAMQRNEEQISIDVHLFLSLCSFPSIFSSLAQSHFIHFFNSSFLPSKRIIANATPPSIDISISASCSSPPLHHSNPHAIIPSHHLLHLPIFILTKLHSVVLSSLSPSFITPCTVTPCTVQSYHQYHFLSSFVNPLFRIFSPSQFLCPPHVCLPPPELRIHPHPSHPWHSCSVCADICTRADTANASTWHPDVGSARSPAPPT